MHDYVYMSTCWYILLVAAAALTSCPRVSGMYTCKHEFNVYVCIVDIGYIRHDWTGNKTDIWYICLNVFNVCCMYNWMNAGLLGYWLDWTRKEIYLSWNVGIETKLALHQYAYACMYVRMYYVRTVVGSPRNLDSSTSTSFNTLPSALHNTMPIHI